MNQVKMEREEERVGRNARQQKVIGHPQHVPNIPPDPPWHRDTDHNAKTRLCGRRRLGISKN